MMKSKIYFFFNIMGTMVQKLIEQACRRVDSNMTYNDFKSTLSDFLKRSANDADDA